MITPCLPDSVSFRCRFRFRWSRTLLVAHYADSSPREVRVVELTTLATNDTGLRCLVAIAQFHSVAADASQLRHEFSSANSSFGDDEILRAAKSLGLRARKRSVALRNLSNA